MPPSSGQPQLLCIGALQPEHNGTNIAVEGRITTVFRTNADSIQKFLLSDLSVRRGISADEIVVFPLGRWAFALATLCREDVLRLERPAVRYNSNPVVNVLKLELDDSLHIHCLAKAPIVTVLDDHRRPTHRFLFDQTGSPRREQCPASREPITPVRNTHPRSTRTRTTRHTSARSPTVCTRPMYSSVPEIANASNSLIGSKVNVFGVVVDARPACLTRGPDLKWNISVVDERSLCTGFASDDPNMFTTLQVFCFESIAAHGIPFCGVGDVLRAHRLVITEWYDLDTGRGHIAAKASFFSTIVLWSFDSDETPTAVKAPFDPHNVAVVDTVYEPSLDESDYTRLRQLRAWARDALLPHQERRFFPQHISVRDIIAVPPAELLTGVPADLLCRIESDTTDGDNTLVRFVASDGGQARLHIESIVSGEHAQRFHGLSFLDCCPSWRLRPTLPAWALLKDVSFVVRGERIVGVLSMQRKTSVVLFLPECARDVQEAKREVLQKSATRVPLGLASVAWHATYRSPVGKSSGQHPYGGRTTCTNGAYATSVAAAITAARPSAAVRSATGSAKNCADTTNSTTATALHSTRRPSPDVCEMEAVTPEHTRRRTGTAAEQCMEGAEKADDSAVRIEQAMAERVVEKRLGDDPAPKRRRTSDEAIYRALGAGTRASDERVICTHEELSRPVSTVAKARTCRGAVRLLVRARGMASPTDLRFACRPWCARCTRFLRAADDARNGMVCGGCGKASGADVDVLSSVDWAYALQLVVEDEHSNCIALWIEGDEAARFFGGGAAATNLATDDAARARIRRIVAAMVSGSSRLDCLALPFVWEDFDGARHEACKLFGTRLVHARLDGESTVVD